KTAKERRQTAAKFARVERWAEDSGSAALMGRELPPDEVLACDQRICWWAGELRKAGLEGGMDELRARAFTHAECVVWCSDRIRPAVYDPVDEQRQAGASSDLADRHPAHGPGSVPPPPLWHGRPRP